MSLRYASLIALALVTGGCLSAARLERPLPLNVSGIAAISTIEIANESGDVVLSGQFSAPEVSGRVTSRVATLSGSETSSTGSATLETAPMDSGGVEDTLNLELEGMRYPSLYRLRIDEKNVAVFSMTNSGNVTLHFSRDTTGR